jgi:hypothetical protein
MFEGGNNMSERRKKNHTTNQLWELLYRRYIIHVIYLALLLLYQGYFITEQ